MWSGYKFNFKTLDKKLVTIRIKNFMWELGTLAGTSVLVFVADFLSSAQFVSLITSHWGEGAVGAIILMFVSSIAKHIRNIQITNKLGSSTDETILI